MKGRPLVAYTVLVSTTGVLSPLAARSMSEAAILEPIQLIPSRWALQVSAVKADGITPGTLTAWDVIIQPSLDGISFNDMTTPFLEHSNASQSIGDVVFSGLANKSFFPLRFYKVDVKTLTLGGTATQLLISLLGLS